MKREYNIRILLGIMLLLLGITVEIIWYGSIYSPLVSGFIAAGIVLIFISAKTGVVTDERTIRAVEKAGTYALMILIGCILVSGLINSFFQLNLNFSLMAIVLPVIGIYLWGILTFYIMKKGDMA
jgi:hypothetical protein